jgi:DNA-binding phage protein
MASRPYKASEYLTNPSDRAAYLNEALESGDFNAFLTALTNIAEAQDAMSVTTTHHANVPNMLDDNESAKLSNLSTLLHRLGLRLSIDVLNPQT